MEITRHVSKQIEASMFRNKVILIFGTRRTGKTTLLKSLYEKYSNLGKRCEFWDCDIIQTKQSLDASNYGTWLYSLKNCDILFIDEAQNVSEIGKSLKLIHDHLPHVQVIATGSSSFDLANKTGEPLVGRNRTFELYPFSVAELYGNVSQSTFLIETYLDKLLRFGSYPLIWTLNEQESIKELKSLINGYLYRDILNFENIKKSDNLVRLLQCLALQIGSEVSFRELSRMLQVSVDTVQKYIDLLKKCYVIFSLHPLTKNLRNELSPNRSRKIYFYDIGIRNALINNFNSMSLRNDVGGLWENFCIVELMKKAQREDILYQHFFWRDYNKKEVDYIQQISINANIYAYEFKYSNNRRVKLPQLFQETYNPKHFKVIHKDNFLREILE